MTKRADTRSAAKGAAASPQGAQRRKTESAEDDSARRDRILAAAGLLFAKRGYASVSVREIADAAGIQGGSLYYHFPSKRELFIGVHRVALTRAVAGIETAISPYTDPWKRFEAAITAHTIIYLDPTSLTQTLMADTSAMMSDMRPELIKDRDRFELIYRKLVDDLPLPSRINRTMYRLFVLSLLNSVTNWYREGRLTPEDIAQQIFWLVKV